MDIESIIGFIFLGIVIFGLFSFLILSFVYYSIMDKKKKEFLDTLDDHDNAVINKYLHIKPKIEDFRNKKHG